MTYEKNPYWYDADKVTVEKLEFMLSADDTAIYAAYNTGDVDFIDTLPTDEIATLLAENNPEFYIVDELGTYYVVFNAASPLFADKTPAGGKATVGIRTPKSYDFSENLNIYFRERIATPGKRYFSQ